MFDSFKKAFNNIKNPLYQQYMDIHTKFKTPPTNDQFKQNGMLSPSEFQKAGDKLVDQGGWKWKPSLNVNYKSQWLPATKQFLILQKVRCQRRAYQIGNTLKNFTETQTEEGVVIIQSTSTTTVQKTQNHKNNQRLYTMYIVYDEFYYTPRMFFSAKTPEPQEKQIDYSEILQDVMDEYKGATLTQQQFKFIEGRKMATVHPCKHASVLKSMTQTIQQGGTKVEAHFALFIFLKFITSVIPTVEFDITGDLWLA